MRGLESLWSIEKSKLGSQIEHFKTEAETLKNDAKDKSRKLERYRNERNNAERQLKNVQSQFKSAKKELKQKKEEVDAEVKRLKEKNAEFDRDLIKAQIQIKELQSQNDQLNKEVESAAIQCQQTTQIEVEQLQQALESSQDQCEKFKKEIEKIRKEKNDLELIERQKKNKRNEKLAEKRKLLKEQQQTENKGEESSSKQQRHEQQQRSSILNPFYPTGQQLNQVVLSTSPRTLPSTPNLSGSALPSNIGVIVQPNTLPFLIPQLNQGSRPSNVNSSPQFHNFPRHLQPQILQHHMSRSFNIPPTNPSINPINNRENQHPQHQFPSSNGLPELMPLAVPQQQQHPLYPKQLNALKQWQQQQAQAMHRQQQPHPSVPPHIIIPPSYHQQQQQYRNR